MKKMNKKAFTLIELLIVIAIIGILFVVLVSRVDFATDKAKATGVQTDFRAFQIAFEQVAKENAGFNTFGWDEGDKVDDALIPAGYTYTNATKDAGDRVRNSYDEGDKNLNGIMDEGEVWTGSRIYTETWTGIYTLVNPGDAARKDADPTNFKADLSAYRALEDAINKNLDPKLQIVISNTVKDDGFEITMANQATDPWKTEYHGYYLTNASKITTTNNVDKFKSDADKLEDKDANTPSLDRGAIIMFSNGANLNDGTVVEIVDGEVVVRCLTAEKDDMDKDSYKSDNNVAGKDDYSVSTIYTYKNGYGEVVSATTGFSNNQ